MARLHRIPADITVFSGQFASQPLVFAHLLDVAPDLTLDHVEVIAPGTAARRLAPYFEADTAARVIADTPDDATLVLILPAAYPGPDCPIGKTDRLAPLGTLRGTIPHLVSQGTQ